MKGYRFKKGVISGILVALSACLFLSRAYAARVRLINQTEFELKAEYYSPKANHLKTRTSIKPKSQKIIDTGLVCGEITNFYFENTTPYGEKAKKEMNSELQVGMGYTGAATLAVCAVAPLLAPPIAIIGSIIVSAKYYYDSIYYDSVMVPNEIPENTEYVLTVTQENSRKFRVSSELVKVRGPESLESEDPNAVVED